MPSAGQNNRILICIETLFTEFEGIGQGSYLIVPEKYY